MIQWFFNLLYGSSAVEWQSAYGLDDSIARLRAVTRKSGFSVLAAPAAVGTVSESKVQLQRVIPMVRNSFKPIFYGRFVERGGQVFLTGQFTMLLFAKVFMSVWFGFLALICIEALLSMLTAPSRAPSRFALLLSPLAMIVFGIGMLRLSHWFSRNDKRWLTRLIQQAITDAPAEPAPEPLQRNSLTGDGARPTVPAIAAVVLGLMGVLNLSAGIAGWYPYRGDSVGFLADHISAAVLRYAVAALGAICLAIAAGVYLRSLLAWRAVFLLIAGAWVTSVAGLLLTHGPMGPPLIIKLVFPVLGLLITFYWLRWWNAQRIHFIDGRAASRS